MPIFSSDDAVKKCMDQNNVINWRVYSDNNEQIHEHFPSSSTTTNESYEALLDFLKGLTGSYVLVSLYHRKYDDKESGDKAVGAAKKMLTYKHYYKLSGSSGVQNIQQPINGMGNGMFGINEFIGLHNQINELKQNYERQENNRIIEELKKELKEAKKDDKKDYLNNLIENIAKNVAKELAGKSDIPLTQTTHEEKHIEAQKTTINENAAQSTNQIKTPAQRAADAVMRLVKVGGIDAIDGIESIAKLIEEKPMEAIALLQQIQEKTE